MLRRSIKSMTISSSSLAAGILVVLAATAGSAEAADPKPDKSGYSLFNPTPESELRDFAPDRPAKNTGANTIDAGHIQLETELVNYSRAKTDTTKTTTWVGPNPTARIGVTNRFEVQINWAPYLHVHQKDIATGDTTSGTPSLG